MDINTCNIYVSDHGLQRILERTHCKRGDVENFLRTVWVNGKSMEQYHTKSAIYKYLFNTIRVGGTDRSIRIKGNTLYIFNKPGTVFVTCYDIPQKVIQDKKNGRVFA